MALLSIYVGLSWVDGELVLYRIFVMCKQVVKRERAESRLFVCECLRELVIPAVVTGHGQFLAVIGVLITAQHGVFEPCLP